MGGRIIPLVLWNRMEFMSTIVQFCGLVWYFMDFYQWSYSLHWKVYWGRLISTGKFIMFKDTNSNNPTLMQVWKDGFIIILSNNFQSSKHLLLFFPMIELRLKCNRNCQVRRVKFNFKVILLYFLHFLIVDGKCKSILQQAKRGYIYGKFTISFS